MRFLVLIFTGIFVILSNACSQDSKETEYTFTNYSLFKNPTELPETFPARFIYKDAKITSAGNYGSGSYRYNRQGVVIQQSNDSPEEIKQHYTQTFKNNGWQIIQSTEEKGVALIMAENSAKRLITVILREKNPVKIKLYYKPISLF